MTQVAVMFDVPSNFTDEQSAVAVVEFLMRAWPTYQTEVDQPHIESWWMIEAQHKFVDRNDCAAGKVVFE